MIALIWLHYWRKEKIDMVRLFLSLSFDLNIILSYCDDRHAFVCFLSMILQLGKKERESFKSFFFN